MWFTEPLKAQLSTIQVRDASGKQVDRGDLHADKKQPTLLHLSLVPNLGPGPYKISWSAVAQDLHVSKGNFTFQVAPNRICRRLRLSRLPWRPGPTANSCHLSS